MPAGSPACLRRLPLGPRDARLGSPPPRRGVPSPLQLCPPHYFSPSSALRPSAPSATPPPRPLPFPGTAPRALAALTPFPCARVCGSRRDALAAVAAPQSREKPGVGGGGQERRRLPPPIRVRLGPGESKESEGDSRDSGESKRGRLSEARTEQSRRGKRSEEMGTAFGQFPPCGVPGQGSRQSALQQGQGPWARPSIAFGSNMTGAGKDVKALWGEPFSFIHSL